MIAGGNISQWKGICQRLRLRMYLRFIDAGVDASTYTQKAQQLVAANDFFTGDFKFDQYVDQPDKRNPFYSTQYVNLNTTNLAASYALLSYMQATADNDRIAYGFKKDATGNYSGTIPNSKGAFTSVKNDAQSELNYYATAPVYFFTQANLQFLIAEVQLRFNNNTAAAKTAYNAAINADFAARFGSAAGASLAAKFLNGSAVDFDKASDKLNLIYMQKWVSFFYTDHMEGWSELRRTDVPKVSSTSAIQIFNNQLDGYSAGDLIVPAANALGTSLVKRNWFPEAASNYNPSTPKQVSIDVPVWWDKK